MIYVSPRYNPNSPSLRSFIPYGPDCPFPIQNLPFGIFSTDQNPQPRAGVAIGSEVLDLAILESESLLNVEGVPNLFDGGCLNAFMAQGPKVWKAVRAAVSHLLLASTPTLRDNGPLRSQAIVPLSSVKMHLPVKVGGFTDFMVSLNHTRNASRMFGAEPPRNFFYLPIGYNGRANTVVVSETPVVRPMGQILPQGSQEPIYAPCRKLDYELEIGILVGQESQMGEPVSVGKADEMIFGFVLLNDWSARDIQAWESFPLGPFQAKSFATSISPWVVLKDALEPFRTEGSALEPEPLPHLRHPGLGHYNVQLEVDIRPAGAKRASTVSRTNFSTMYWNSAQMVTHHASSGCRMSVGDLLGSGTISGPLKGSAGCLLESTVGGAEPIDLEQGGTRCFLEDGDEVVMRGWCQGEGYRVGFGEVKSVVLPSPVIRE